MKEEKYVVFETIVSGSFALNENSINSVEINDQIKLKRDPKNKYDKNALKILNSSGKKIGYIPKQLAKVLSPYLEDGNKVFNCHVSQIGWVYNSKQILIKFSVDKNYSSIIKKSFNTPEGGRHPRRKHLTLKSRIDEIKKHLSLENQFDALESRIKVYVSKYLYELQKNILWQITEQLSLNSYKTEQIKTPGILKYKSEIKEYMYDAVQIGISSVAVECQSTKKTTIENKYKKWINTRLKQLIDKQIDDTIFSITFNIDSILELKKKPYSNQDVLDALNKAQGRISDNLDYYITHEGIKLGRSIAAENL